MGTEDPHSQDEHYAGARAAIHDLNNLLNIALANVQLLSRESLESSAAARLEKVESALKRCAETVATLSGLLRKP